MRIAIFYHSCCINNWKEIISDQAKTLHDSGLPKVANDIHIHVSEIQDGFSGVWSIVDNAIIYENPNKHLFEEYALVDLQRYCNQHDAYVLYFHSKGVRSPPMHKKSWAWRKYLEYFSVTHWKDCIEKLKEYDCCGAQYQKMNRYKKESPHFAGNFWWATSKYIRTLPDVRKLPHRENMLCKGRVEQEHWIGTNPAHKAYNFHYIEGCLYQKEIKREEYVRT